MNCLCVRKWYPTQFDPYPKATRYPRWTPLPALLPKFVLPILLHTLFSVSPLTLVSNIATIYYEETSTPWDFLQISLSLHLYSSSIGSSVFRESLTWTINFRSLPLQALWAFLPTGSFLAGCVSIDLLPLSIISTCNIFLICHIFFSLLRPFLYKDTKYQMSRWHHGCHAS